MTSTGDSQREIAFVQKAAKHFAEHPEHTTFTDGDVKPGVPLALRWGMGDDCVLVVWISEEGEVVNYQGAISEANPSVPPSVATMRHRRTVARLEKEVEQANRLHTDAFKRAEALADENETLRKQIAKLTDKAPGECCTRARLTAMERLAGFNAPIAPDFLHHEVDALRSQLDQLEKGTS
ncbi:hypothetical protein [Larsenimonas suaedae]|uniref:Uncharacterized protein n=1 Tax=Larsenimonas suaedae TaxID=1851019 RepID=A0ABU1GZ52_9GAMM|nr:hypothetical protein [Larsenimonas suaedae]MCM2973802.1 hypothetical protein [Larsenimonas suaedae]MDR5897326.1 hypothetical protein [Larsenimonas suaedae]